MVEEITQQEETQTVGTILRNARLKKGKTVADVADDLCIRKLYINAIENMDYKNIPPLPYGIGFIRSYAHYLGLNSDRIVSSYRQSFLAKDETRHDESATNVEVSTPHFKHIFIGLCGLAALFIAWSVLPVSEPVEEYREESSDVVPEPIIVEDEADLEVKKEIKAEDDKDVATGQNMSAEPEDTAESAVTEISKPESTTETLDTATEQSHEASDVVPENTAAETAEAQNPEPDLPRMKLVVTGPSWLELRQGETVIIKGDVYNKGYEYEIPNESGLSVTVGRPRNVAFYLDGQPVKVVSVMKRKNVSLDEFLNKQN